MPSPAEWLTKLKTPQLHRLAVLLGTPCPSTKVARIAAINGALSLCRRVTGENGKGDGHVLPERVSLVSIDMGIRNLAFAHLTSRVEAVGTLEGRRYGPVTLEAWRKIDVSGSGGLDREARLEDGGEQQEKGTSETVKPETGSKIPAKLVAKVNEGAESFDPAIYAEHAYSIIRSVVDRYKPTHIVIERQRFRSGGSSAVLEWTIRVGVFEGMLYAVLRTLRGVEVVDGSTPIVEGILPAKVNRFWLEGGQMTSKEQKYVGDAGSDGTVVKSRMKGKEVKKAKIEIVAQLLEDVPQYVGTSERRPKLPLKFGKNVQDVVNQFRNEVQRPAHGRRKRSVGKDGVPPEEKISKLDDLSDCLLQGLAWLNWQNNRLRVQCLEQTAFDLAGDAVASPATRRSKSKSTTEI